MRGAEPFQFPEGRRIFLALPVRGDLAYDIGEWQRDHERLFPPARGREGVPVRWVEERNLHMTLLPPWHVADPAGDIERFAAFDWDVDSAPFHVSFRAVRYGPSPQRPNLIWAGGSHVPALGEFVARLATYAGMPQARAFRPHITLARFKYEEFTSFRLKRLEDAVVWEGVFDCAVLLESHLSRTGAQYEVLQTYPFAG